MPGIFDLSNRISRQNAIMVAAGTAGLYLWTEGGVYNMIATPIGNAVPALSGLAGNGPMAIGTRWLSGGALFMVGSQFSAIQYIS